MCVCGRVGSACRGHTTMMGKWIGALLRALSKFQPNRTNWWWLKRKRSRRRGGSCDIDVGGDSPWAGPGEERPPLGRSVGRKDEFRWVWKLKENLLLLKRLHHFKTSYCNLRWKGKTNELALLCYRFLKDSTRREVLKGVTLPFMEIGQPGRIQSLWEIQYVNF